MGKREEFLWSAKYRPLTVKDCILPDSIKGIFTDFLSQGEIQHMIFSGSSGVGKTTVAMALCEELGSDYIIINGSSEAGIDVLRTKITDFVTSVSLNGKPKVVIIDEADGMNPNSIQPALRNFLETFSSNSRFIFTCNYANKIIAPLKSRCKTIEFKLDKQDRPKMASRFMKRLSFILEAEDVEYDSKVVAQVLTRFFPDYRKILNELQSYSLKGSIDEGVLSHVKDVDISNLVDALRGKDFKLVRQWVENNLDNNVHEVLDRVYDTLIDQIVEVPNLVLIIADWNYKSYFAANQKINLSACFVEIMASTNFKE